MTPDEEEARRAEAARKAAERAQGGITGLFNKISKAIGNSLFGPMDDRFGAFADPPVDSPAEPANDTVQQPKAARPKRGFYSI
jgi:hypothetical protein